MAELNFGKTGEEPAIPAMKENEDTAKEPSPVTAQDVNTNGASLTMEELNDPNKIKVTIADSKTPLVILFGPPSCGKTMTLIRLTRYLLNKGYTVQPVTSFRPAYDKNYITMCDGFDNMIYSDDAAKSTGLINFMLVQVLYNGRPLCQILESPGEYYFDPDKPDAPFPRYVNAVINSPNRKVWAIMIEPDKTNRRMDDVTRKHYANKINRLKKQIKPRDKVIFVFNKIDETPHVISPGKIRYIHARENVENLYPNIFKQFENENPITKWFNKYNFGFVAFQTGNFTKAADGSLVFEPGDEIYPRNLWNIIRKHI